MNLYIMKESFDEDNSTLFYAATIEASVSRYSENIEDAIFDFTNNTANKMLNTHSTSEALKKCEKLPRVGDIIDERTICKIINSKEYPEYFI